MSEVEEYIIAEELRPGLKGINIKVKCASIEDEREVVARKTGETLRVTEALVGDETGSVLLTLWNDDIDKMIVDKVYALKNVYTTVFKNYLRLNIGRYGTMEEIEEETPAEVNVENNLSNKYIEQQPRFRPRQPYGRSYRDDRSGGRGNRGRGPRRRY
ncbi:MAG: single-stranded DNA-binding protein [Candidatus Helarchaeota archaeon]